MPKDRFQDRVIFFNNAEVYAEVFEERGVSGIQQFAMPNMSTVPPPIRGILNPTTIMWKRGDSFQKLAANFYGDSRYWWVIAWYNYTPTEAHVRYGSSIDVPFPLDRVLAHLRG